MNRLKEKRMAAGLTQEALAEAADTSRGTIAKIEGGSRQLSVHWAQRFAPHVDATPAQLMFDDSMLLDSATSRVRMVQVKAHVQAGDWTERDHWADSEFYDVAVPTDPHLDGFTLYAAETRGPSMNKRYPEGSVLIFTDIIETGEEIEPGRRYVVERQRADGLCEVTVKTLWLDDEGHPWLVPESEDPRHQQPIGINGNNEEETIRIMGRVRYAVLKE